MKKLLTIAMVLAFSLFFQTACNEEANTHVNEVVPPGDSSPLPANLSSDSGPTPDNPKLSVAVTRNSEASGEVSVTIEIIDPEPGSIYYYRLSEKSDDIWSMDDGFWRLAQDTAVTFAPLKPTTKYHFAIADYGNFEQETISYTWGNVVTMEATTP